MRNDYDYCDGIKQINITQKILLKHQNKDNNRPEYVFIIILHI